MSKVDSRYSKNYGDNNYWNRLDSVVTKFLKQEDAVRIYYFKQLCQYWELVLEKKMAKKIVPQGWQNNTLVLIMEDGSYVNFIRYRKNIILSKIRAILQNDFCKDLKTVVGDMNLAHKFRIKNHFE